MFQAKLQKQLLGQLSVHAGHKAESLESRGKGTPEDIPWQDTAEGITRYKAYSLFTSSIPQGAEQPPSCPTSGRGPLLLELEQNSYKLLRITHFFKKYTQVLVSCCWNLSQHAEPFFLPDTSWFTGSCTLFLHSRVLPTLFQHRMPTANWRYKGLSSFRETKSKAANIITPPPTVVEEKIKKEKGKWSWGVEQGFLDESNMSRTKLHNECPLTFVISPSQLLQKSICYCLFGYQSKLLWEERKGKKEMLSSY